VEEVHELLHLDVRPQLTALDGPLHQHVDQSAKWPDHAIQEALVELGVVHRLGQHARRDREQAGAGKPFALEIHKSPEVAGKAARVGRVAARRHHRHAGDDQIVLRLPAPVDRRLADPRRGRDSLDRRGGDAVLGDHLQRRGEDRLIGVLAARPATTAGRRLLGAGPVVLPL